MERSELPPHKSATYVLSRWKVVYVAVPKAACTSLKWLIADLQEENRERFYTALTREVTRATTIHRRPQWRRTPMLHRLSDEELAEISPERGWFVFTVIRHPSSRLWSAWQSKLLLREPRWVRRFGTEPWFPRIPSRSSDIVEDFQRFVRSIAENRDQKIMRDRHFLSQSRLVTPEKTPYTRIYETQEIDELLQDLAAQLRRYGWDGSLSLDSANETPLRPLASMFSSEVVDAIAAVYGEDFERFGYENVVPEPLEPAEEYGEAALLEIRRLLERAERIGDLVLKAQRLQGQNKAQRQEIRELRRELNRVSARARLDGGLARKVRRRMSRALSRA
ncbi:MAG: sulfotransferase family 2 domain-containing protein [Actinomycetota bacterium]|nr:sulfotransferase family 2 domain-containing protein [Actinomycetota bacterium]